MNDETRQWTEESDIERQHRPWAICRLGVASEKNRVVARFANRQDADDYLRSLYRLMRLKLQQFEEDNRPRFVVIWDGVQIKKALAQNPIPQIGLEHPEQCSPPSRTTKIS
jgi:hypothetical protein